MLPYTACPKAFGPSSASETKQIVTIAFRIVATSLKGYWEHSVERGTPLPLIFERSNCVDNRLRRTPVDTSPPELEFAKSLLVNQSPENFVGDVIQCAYGSVPRA